MEQELFQNGSEHKSTPDSLDLNMSEVEGRDLPSLEANSAEGSSVYACCTCSCCC